MRRRCLAIIGLIFVATVVWSARANAQDAGATFKAKCALCHGPDGKGDTVVGKKIGARDFASPEIQKQLDADLIQVVTKGKNKMPAF